MQLGLFRLSLTSGALLVTAAFNGLKHLPGIALAYNPAVEHEVALVRLKVIKDKSRVGDNEARFEALSPEIFLKQLFNDPSDDFDIFKRKRRLFLR